MTEKLKFECLARLASIPRRRGEQKFRIEVIRCLPPEGPPRHHISLREWFPTLQGQRPGGTWFTIQTKEVDEVIDALIRAREILRAEGVE